MKSSHDVDVASLRRFDQPLLGIFDGNLCAAQKKRRCVKLSTLLAITARAQRVRKLLGSPLKQT
jgi:hypothetical protein